MSKKTERKRATGRASATSTEAIDEYAIVESACAVSRGYADARESFAGFAGDVMRIIDEQTLAVQHAIVTSECCGGLPEELSGLDEALRRLWDAAVCMRSEAGSMAHEAGLAGMRYYARRAK